MKTLTQFRESGLRALDGKWGKAILAALIHSAFYGSSITPSIEFKFDAPPEFDHNINVDLSIFDGLAKPTVIGIIIAISVLVLSTLIAVALVGSIVDVGYSKYNLELADGEDPSIARLFCAFSDWKRIIVAYLLVFVRVFFGLILFIIPGIITAYTYAAVPHILAEDKSLTAGQVLEKSKSIMSGQRGRLFLLQLSFIGWDILTIITLGILSIWLNPFKRSTFADFYREVSDTRPKPETDEFDHFATTDSLI